MKQVKWNARIYNEFLELSILSDFQRQVLDMHVKKKTDLQIAMELHTSESSVQRAIRELKDIYDEVQPYSSILPIRLKSKTEKLKEM